MLKRLWDTENKKMVFAKWPSGHECQVWTDADGSHLYIYDCSQWLVYDPSAQWASEAKEYWPTWKALDDEEVGYYDTNVPTELYNWDEGDDVAYAFKNWTNTLQSGKVKEWQTPTYTWATPTKAATAQYTYTFDDWDPEVGPIYKKTNFKATFTSTVNKYTVSIASNNTDYGTVDEASVANVPYGTKISAEDNVLTIGEGTSKTEVTATAETGYVFSSWNVSGEALPSSVSWALSITATFEAEPEPETPTDPETPTEE